MLAMSNPLGQDSAYGLNGCGITTELPALSYCGVIHGSVKVVSACGLIDVIWLRALCSQVVPLSGLFIPYELASSHDRW